MKNSILSTSRLEKNFIPILFRAQTTARSRGETEERSFNGSFKRAAIVRTARNDIQIKVMMRVVPSPSVIIFFFLFLFSFSFVHKERNETLVRA